MNPRPAPKRPERCDLRPELAACFAIRPMAVRPERADPPLRGVLAELAQYGRP
jgi:hypothetical protein